LKGQFIKPKCGIGKEATRVQKTFRKSTGKPRPPKSYILKTPALGARALGKSKTDSLGSLWETLPGKPPRTRGGISGRKKVRGRGSGFRPTGHRELRGYSTYKPFWVMGGGKKMEKTNKGGRTKRRRYSNNEGRKNEVSKEISLRDIMKEANREAENGKA